MNWVFSCQEDHFKDEVPNVEALGFHHGIILLGHEIFVPCYSLLYIHPYLVNKIEVKTKLFVVFLILILHHTVVGHVYFCRYDWFTLIG